MKPELTFSAAAGVQSELLVAFAADHNLSKDKDAVPSVALLTSEAALTEAAQALLHSGEFKAGPNETLLLHSPEGLAAKRLLVVGLGKSGKATVHDLRKAAGRRSASPSRAAFAKLRSPFRSWRSSSPQPASAR